MILFITSLRAGLERSEVESKQAMVLGAWHSMIW
jgi:hypothetical protein